MCVCVCFPSSSAGKESACNVGDLGSIPGLGRSPGGGHGNPFKYSCLENPHGQRSLMGYIAWGRKESDMIEWRNTAKYIYNWSFLTMCVCVCVLAFKWNKPQTSKIGNWGSIQDAKTGRKAINLGSRLNISPTDNLLGLYLVLVSGREMPTPFRV